MTGVLLKAVSAGRLRQVRLLLDSGINVEYKDDCGQTALIRAVFVEHTRQREKIIKLLLRSGAKVSTTDIVGRNALSWACLYGHDRDVKNLLEWSDLDLDLNQGDMNGQTALFHAGTSGSAATVKMMVDALGKYRLDMDVPNYNGVTPLMQAMRLGHDVCASILQHQGGAVVGFHSDTDVIEELATAERWATSRTAPPTVQDAQPDAKDAANKSTDKQQIKTPKRGSQFPPILSQAAAQKIKYRENRAGQLRLQTPLDSEDDSTYGSEVSYYTDESFAGINTPVDTAPAAAGRLFEEVLGRQPHKTDSTMTIRSFSMTSSTENNVSSEDDEGPPPRAVQQDDNWDVFQPCRDLPRLYRIYEQLTSPSYRPPVSSSGPPPTRTAAGTVQPESSTNEDCPKDVTHVTRMKRDVQKLSELRRMLLRKQTRQAKLKLLSLPIVAPTKFPAPPPDGSSSSETDGGGDCFHQRRPVLPRITKLSTMSSDNLGPETDELTDSM